MSRHKKVALFWWIGVAIVIFAALCAWAFYFRFFVFTNDAYVHGNQVYVTPLQDGFVTSIRSDDTFLVKKGQLLVTFDQTDAQIALASSCEALAATVRQVCELFYQLDYYGAEMEMKSAELIRDAQDFFHRFSVFRQQAISLEDYEHAIAALRAQYSSLEMSAASYNQTLSAIQSSSISSHPLVLGAAEAVRERWVELVRCNLYAPVDGLVAQRTVQVGMWVPAGQPLLSVIPLDQIWVNANYKETQVGRMRIGQPVDIHVDMWGNKTLFHGTIAGLPGGAGNAFSLLPPQNLSGNWIKIVQRLPVRVALDPDEVRDHPLRLGLSCTARASVHDQSGPLVPESTTVSPTWSTPIFEAEESGDLALIEKIIASNLAPGLEQFATAELIKPPAKIDLTALLRDAFQQDLILSNESQ